MKQKFKSFVFPETTKKQIDAMPAEMKLKFYIAVTDYGMYDIEPEDLSEMEKLIWIPMKDLIDSCKASRGGAPEGNSNAAKHQKEEKTTETTQNNKNNQNNVVFTETTQTTFNNGNGNGNLNGNENVNTQSQDKELCEDVCVPAYIPDPNKKINKETAKTLFEEVQKHNETAPKERKVPVSSNIFNFSCKEMREIIVAAGVDEDPDRIIAALRNFLQVCKSDTWQKSHTWSTFCKHYQDYTPEYFTLERYLVAEPQTDDASRRPENIFFFAHKDEPEFHVETFQEHIDDWKEAGRPEGTAYYELQASWEVNNNAD